MQIQLRQKEIETAIKLFVSQQGINLTNKTIDIVFTAGRKESGISAEMTIEDVCSVLGNCTVSNQTVVASLVKPEENTITPAESEPQPNKAESLFASK
jgi:hypothetical protein